MFEFNSDTKFLKITLFIILSVLNFQIALSATQCLNHAYVGIAIVKRNIVESLLEDGFTLPDSHPLDKLMSKDEYPLLLEFGEQLDCYFYLTMTKHSFIEFKLEVPYVSHKEGYKELVYKPIIFASAFLDAIGSKIMYGLNVIKADMEIIEGEDIYYNVKTDKGSMNATIKYADSDSKLLTEFKEIANKPWYCYSPFRSVKCASMDYEWNQMKEKSISIEVSIKGDILGEKLNGLKLKTALVNTEIYVSMAISFPFSCPK